MPVLVNGRICVHIERTDRGGSRGGAPPIRRMDGVAACPYNTTPQKGVPNNSKGYLNKKYYSLQSHFLSANALRVGLPFGFFIGPGMPPILAQNDLRRAADLGDLAACFAETGGFKFMPLAFAERRPAAFNPPLGFFPSLRCQAAVLAITCIS